MYRNITRAQDFSGHINIVSPHRTVSKWALKMNIICQSENDYDVWVRYIERLISKTIPSPRIQQEIDQNIIDLSTGYCKISGQEMGQLIPTTIQHLIKSNLPPVSPRIYEDVWLDADPEDYEFGLPEVTPPLDAPSSITSGWVRKYYYEDLRDHINREEAILDRIESNYKK